MDLSEEEIIMSGGRPAPTNAALHELLSLTDCVVIKEGGASDGKALSDVIVLKLQNPVCIAEFSELFQIIDPEEWFHCVCSGDYAIELYSHKELIATIGFHHGRSIRYDAWTGDAELSKSDGLLEFFAAHGLSKPLEDLNDAKARIAKQREPFAKWLDNAPNAFESYLSKNGRGDERAFRNMISDLNKEIPDMQQRIIALLQCYGYSDNLWADYFDYEALPSDVLMTMPLQIIIGAYCQSDRNYKTRIGLGRFLCIFGFNSISREQFEYIPDALIDELEACFKNLHDERSAGNIRHLRSEKQKSLI